MSVSLYYQLLHQCSPAVGRLNLLNVTQADDWSYIDLFHPSLHIGRSGRVQLKHSDVHHQNHQENRDAPDRCKGKFPFLQKQNKVYMIRVKKNNKKQKKLRALQSTYPVRALCTLDINYCAVDNSMYTHKRLVVCMHEQKVVLLP